MTVMLRRRGVDAKRHSSAPLSAYATSIAAAAAGTGKAKILFVGDSVVEGEGASVRANRWIDQLIQLIRTRYGIGGSGVGLTAWHYATYLDVSAGWRTQTNSGVEDLSWFGTQGYRGAVMDPGTYVQWSVTGDSIDVVYAGLQASDGGGSLVVAVDGSTVATINTAAADAYLPGLISHVSLGTAGAHTVRITESGSGTGALLDGIVVYDGDYTAGVTYWDCSHTAFTSDDFVDNSTDYQLGWANYLPTLIVDQLIGLNEYNQSQATPSHVAANLTARIAVYKALASHPTIVVWVPMMTTSYTPNTPNSLGYTREQYYTAAIAAANAAGGVTVFDARSVYPSPDPSWFPTANGGELGDIGHQVTATAFDTYLATV
jgi:hypothetical protein